MTPQARLRKVLDHLAALTSRERVVAEDQIRHDRNGHDPSVVDDMASQLERVAQRLERRR